MPITAERHALAQITRQRYYRLYERLCGMTGTASGCEREFRQVYGLRVEPIPLRVPSRREILPTRFFTDSSAKWEAIARSVGEFHPLGRPVLIGTRSIQDSEQLGELCCRREWGVAMLNGRQDAADLPKRDEGVLQVLENGVGEDGVERVVLERDRVSVREEVGRPGGVVDADVAEAEVLRDHGLVARAASEVQESHAALEARHGGREEFAGISRGLRAVIRPGGRLDGKAVQKLFRPPAEFVENLSADRPTGTEVERSSDRPRLAPFAAGR